MAQVLLFGNTKYKHQISKTPDSSVDEKYYVFLINTPSLRRDFVGKSMGKPIPMHNYYAQGHVHSQQEAVLDPLHYSRFVRSTKHIMHVCCLLDLRRPACRTAIQLAATSPPLISAFVGKYRYGSSLFLTRE